MRVQAAVVLIHVSMLAFCCRNGGRDRMPVLSPCKHYSLPGVPPGGVSRRAAQSPASKGSASPEPAYKRCTTAAAAARVFAHGWQGLHVAGSPIFPRRAFNFPALSKPVFVCLSALFPASFSTVQSVETPVFTRLKSDSVDSDSHPGFAPAPGTVPPLPPRPGPGPVHCPRRELSCTPCRCRRHRRISAPSSPFPQPKAQLFATVRGHRRSFTLKKKSQRWKIKIFGSRIIPYVAMIS
jgi:hypothetical protein